MICLILFTNFFSFVLFRLLLPSFPLSRRLKANYKLRSYYRCLPFHRWIRFIFFHLLLHKQKSGTQFGTKQVISVLFFFLNIFGKLIEILTVALVGFFSHGFGLPIARWPFPQPKRYENSKFEQSESILYWSSCLNILYITKRWKAGIFHNCMAFCIVRWWWQMWITFFFFLIWILISSSKFVRFRKCLLKSPFKLANISNFRQTTIVIIAQNKTRQHKKKENGKKRESEKMTAKYVQTTFELLIW